MLIKENDVVMNPSVYGNELFKVIKIFQYYYPIACVVGLYNKQKANFPLCLTKLVYSKNRPFKLLNNKKLKNLLAVEKVSGEVKREIIIRINSKKYYV